MTIRLLACLLLAAPALTGALAQEPGYRADLLRLAELMGSLGHLETVCGDPDAGVWRDQMSSLVAAQAMPAEERRDYVGAFNRGYETFANIHRSCTAQAQFAIERYLAEGVVITDRLEAAYGGDDGAAPR